MDNFWKLLAVAWETLQGAIWYGFGVMSLWGLRRFRRRRLRKPAEEAYMNLRRVVEPGTMDPSNPGNAEYMRAYSRDEINLLHPKLNRANFPTPPPMDLTDESARDWFRALGHIRMKT